jgi:hypothetical protein
MRNMRGFLELVLGWSIEAANWVVKKMIRAVWWVSGRSRK